jgi:hypothetical protein
VTTLKWILFIIAFLISFFWIKGIVKEHKQEKETKKKAIIEQQTAYSTSGKGIAIMESPIKAYLDPLKTYTRIIGDGNAKYVLESDLSKFFICNEKPGTESGHIQTWWAMPAGNYLIYPEGIPKIVFSWY